MKSLSLIIIMLIVLSGTAYGDNDFRLNKDVNTYLKKYNYSADNKAKITSLLCSCINRFDALGELIQQQNFSGNGSEGIIIAIYSLSYLTMDAYSFTNGDGHGKTMGYLGRENSYGIDGVKNIYADNEKISSVITNLLQNDRIVIKDFHEITDSGCYYIYAYQNDQSVSWLVPYEILLDPGSLQGTVFESLEEIIIGAQYKE